MPVVLADSVRCRWVMCSSGVESANGICPRIFCRSGTAQPHVPSSLGLTRLSNFSPHSGWFFSSSASRFPGTHVTPVFFFLVRQCFLSLAVRSRSTHSTTSWNSNVIGATSFRLSGPTHAPHNPASTGLNLSA